MLSYDLETVEMETGLFPNLGILFVVSLESDTSGMIIRTEVKLTENESWALISICNFE